MNKTQLLTTLQTRNPTLTKSDLNGVLDTLSQIVIETLKTEGAVVVPGIVKLTVKDKPAQPEKQGLDPFTKQPRTFAAKPASKKVLTKPLKVVKDALSVV